MESKSLSPSTPAGVDLAAPIVCRVTRWYFRRMAMGIGLFFIFGCAFLYDGIWGYPKYIALANKKEWFTKEYLPSFDKAKQEGRLDQWLADAKAKDLPTGVDGEPPKWVSYAAQNNWEENPKLYTQREVAEQFWFGYGCLAGSAVIGVLLLRNRSKVLKADQDSWVTPEGIRVLFADVFRIDKRKWEHKGLAYAWYKGAGGAEKRAVIDDLKYGGADQVLERMLSRFNGELIEKITAPEPVEQGPVPGSE